MEYPRDIFTLRMLHELYLYSGDVAASKPVSRVLPYWGSEFDDAWYSALMGMRTVGLAENGRSRGGKAAQRGLVGVDGEDNSPRSGLRLVACSYREAQR